MKKLLTLLFFVLAGTFAFASGHVVTATANNPTCYGASNGLAVATASGGIGPYGYTWTGPSGFTATGPSISGLAAGTYVVTAIDSSDMSTALYTINLTQPSALVSTVGGGGTICAGSAVSLYVAPSGGSSPYSYSWSPATGLSSTTAYNPVASPVSTTTYTVTTTDMMGCVTTATITVVVNPNPSVSVNSLSTCAGQPAVLTASGASTYSWAAVGTTGNPITVNPASTTTYTVTGTMNGCTGTAIATVTVNTAPVITTSPSSSSCNICNGSIVSSTSPGTTYNWSGPNGYSSTLTSPSNLCTGTYTLIATGATGCSSTTTTTVGSLSTVTLTTSSVPSNCGACDGAATVNASGGTVPYSFSWNPTGNTTPTSTGLCAGIYYATVTDANGCTATSTVVISNTSTLAANLTTTSTSCNACNGMIAASPTGGTGPYTYLWSPGGVTTPNHSGLCAGTYNVTITDSSGCSVTSSATVTSTNPVYVTASSTASTCGACNGAVSVAATGGTPGYMYSIDNGVTQQASGNFSGICAGAYVATVTDANGCTGIYTVGVSSSNTGTFTVSNSIQNETGYGLHDGSINLTISGSTAPYAFTWSNGATSEDIYSLAGGTYTVTITDNNGDCATYTYTVGSVPSYGYISGFLYNDNNTNCIFDAGDSPLYGYYVAATNGTNTYYGYTNNSGNYMIWVPGGSYTVVTYNSANLEAGCTSSYSLSVAGGNTYTNNNFAYVIPPVYDVCVYTWTPGVVPGFNGNYNTSLYNYGNQPASGIVYLVLPAAVNYVSSSPMASYVSGDTVFWSYTNLPSYSSLSFNAYYYTPVSAVLGTTAIAYANAILTNGVDSNPACNSTTYTRIISGSFDPNDKTVSPSGEGPAGDIPLTESEFTYLIRFQNTGNGPAVNISVTDTLSSLLDPMSFRMLDASHNYTVEMLPGNVLRWQFDNIMLPDSTSNEAGSHGNIQFRVNKLNTPLAGEVIENKAYIYFDFNAPVITNTAVNTYSVAASIAELLNENGTVLAYPNPFSDNTTFVIRSEKQNGTYSFELTDVIGKKVKQMNTSEKQFTVSRSGLQNGMYFYRITDAQGKAVGMGKLIVK